MSLRMAWSCSREFVYLCAGHAVLMMRRRSAVLWVAQNMEDEYTYNLAL
jgi:hypothetical protein